MSSTTTLDHPAARGLAASAQWGGAPAPSTLPQTLLRSGPVVALRQRDTIALGALRDRLLVAGDRLVAGHGLDGQTWWLPGDAVWLDADAPDHPEHPRPTGLATATSREHAIVAGLSDRLGWEAVLELERGGQLPAADVDTDLCGAVEVLDGRLGHDVPVVVVIGQDFVRWAAGATWDGAVHRALYGDEGNDKVAIELAEMADTLDRSGLGVVVVDLDTPLLRRAGITRCSAQLVVRRT